MFNFFKKSSKETQKETLEDALKDMPKKYKYHCTIYTEPNLEDFSITHVDSLIENVFEDNFGHLMKWYLDDNSSKFFKYEGTSTVLLIDKTTIKAIVMFREEL